MFTLSWDDSDIKIYRNGAEIIGGLSDEGNWSNTNESFLVGKNYQGNDSTRKWWNGSIDELGIWNRSLTLAEVDELYNNGTGFNPFKEIIKIDLDKVWSYWDFDNQSLIDRTEKHNWTSGTYTSMTGKISYGARATVYGNSQWGMDIDDSEFNFSKENFSISYWTYFNTTTSWLVFNENTFSTSDNYNIFQSANGGTQRLGYRWNSNGGFTTMYSGTENNWTMVTYFKTRMNVFSIYIKWRI